jgi:hypothetical protein
MNRYCQARMDLPLLLKGRICCSVHSERALLHPPFPDAASDRICAIAGKEKQVEQRRTVYSFLINNRYAQYYRSICILCCNLKLNYHCRVVERQTSNSGIGRSADAIAQKCRHPISESVAVRTLSGVIFASNCTRLTHSIQLLHSFSIF